MPSDASINLPYIAITGVAIAAALIAILIFRPLLTEISTVQGEISETLVTLDEREQFLRTIDRKLAQLDAQQVDEQRLAVMLPSDESMEDALRVVHRAGEASGLTVRVISNNSRSVQSQANIARARGEQVSAPDMVTPLGFNLQFQGTYQQFRAFIKELERSPRLMDISQFQLQKDALTTDLLSGQASVTFYLQDFDADTAEDAPL